MESLQASVRFAAFETPESCKTYRVRCDTAQTEGLVVEVVVFRITVIVLLAQVGVIGETSDLVQQVSTTR